jgi:hypothetical protein
VHMSGSADVEFREGDGGWTLPDSGGRRRGACDATVARGSSSRDSPDEGRVRWTWATFVLRPAQRTKEERP